MKIVITENRRNEAVTKWLNKNYSDLRKYSAPGSFRFIHYKNESDENIFMYNRDTGLVTISDKTLIQYLKHMFSLSGYELNNILIPWLEQSYNLHVELVEYSFSH